MAGNLVPRTDGGSDLGTAAKEYGTIYAKNFGGTIAAKINAAISGGGNAKAPVYIYTSGTYTVPEGVTTLYISGCAGGGGGSAVYGGGAGESVKRKKITVTPGEQITVTIGAGGNASVSDKKTYTTPSAAAGSGGDTSFGSYLTLRGGKGATYSGSSDSISTWPERGGNGGTDGEVACLTFKNENATVWKGGTGGSTMFGIGGSGGSFNQGLATTGSSSAVNQYKNGTDGIGYGSGGGGCALIAVSAGLYISGAGNGASGLIIVELT